MRLWSVFRKAMREQRRDLATLVISLLGAPFFVFIYWLMLGGGSTAYTVLVLDEGRGAGAPVVEALRSMTYPDGAPILKVVLTTERTRAEQKLRDREADALVVMPAGYTDTVAAVRDGRAEAATPLLFVGDLSNPRYAVAAIMAATAADQYVSAATGRLSPMQMQEEALGDSATRSEFELYVPGLLILAVEMIIFKLSMMIAAEREAGTLQRLQLSRMTAFDYLAGISLSQVLLGAISVVLTFWTAQALGFESEGSLWLAMLIGVVTSLSVIGFGLMVAAFARTANQAGVLSTFPLFLLMFFTGAAFPLPKVTLFHLGERAVHLQDLLPPSHGVNALNKVLTLGAGLNEVAFDLVALLLLSALAFGTGVWLFRRVQTC